MARPSWNHAPAAFLIVSLLVVLEIGTVAACPFHSRSGRTLSRKPGGEGHKLKKSQNAASVRRVWPSSRALMSAPEPQLDAVSGLDYNYYAKSCPSLQAVVNRHMAAAYGDDDTSTAPIMRLLFHDCFVRVSLVATRKVFSSGIFDGSDVLLSEHCLADPTAVSPTF